jgi:hypothetical protein
MGANRRDAVWCTTIGLLLVLSMAEVVAGLSFNECYQHCLGARNFEDCMDRFCRRGSPREEEARGAVLLTRAAEDGHCPCYPYREDFEECRQMFCGKSPQIHGAGELKKSKEEKPAATE